MNILGVKMDAFKSLVNVIERLLGPGGCPWDREQTLQSMRSALLEESFEVIESIVLNDDILLEEELGDLFCQAVFLSMLAAKENRFTLKDVLNHITTKLIRRHPHVFGEKKIEDSEEVLKQWEAIKKVEHKEKRPSVLDGIPKDLPALSRAKKILRKLKGNQFKSQIAVDSLTPEEKAGEFLFDAVKKFESEGIDAEHALRKRLSQFEAELRKQEK